MTRLLLLLTLSALPAVAFAQVPNDGKQRYQTQENNQGFHGAVNQDQPFDVQTNIERKHHNCRNQRPRPANC